VKSIFIAEASPTPPALAGDDAAADLMRTLLWCH
jgi:hypothetical protein